jgi:hypothetical protein
MQPDQQHKKPGFSLPPVARKGDNDQKKRLLNEIKLAHPREILGTQFFTIGSAVAAVTTTAENMAAPPLGLEEPSTNSQ